ncbi:MAG: ATP-binding cassette domain-containing protein [Planctomycetota bacterium]
MIQTDKLTKYYGKKVAVNQVSFQLKKGEILGFLGPNGAGKSTTMKMLTTFLYPTSGTAILNGYDICKDPLKVREQIGYLPENAPLYDEMLVKNFLRFAAEARRVSQVTQAVERVIEQCFLREVKNQPIFTLSKGYRQRVCFAQAILHNPEILILDEPTDGLDPNQKAEVRKMISAMGAGKAILLSTHILEEARATCTRAIIISEGTIKVDDTPQNLLKLSPQHGVMQLRLMAEIEDEFFLRKTLKELPQIESVETKKEENKCYFVSIRPEKGKEVSGEVLHFLQKKQWKILSCSISEGRLEDVFQAVTQSSQEQK